MTRLAAGFAVLFLAVAASAFAQSRPPATTCSPECDIDLRRVGQMQDILSNALMLGLHQPESRVEPFLREARNGCASGAELLGKTAIEFRIPEADLAAEVERYRHVNCTHAGGGEADAQPESIGGLPLSAFATDVTLHVVLHELGHALIREFDLPVLANEETMADAFATHYLTTHLPERAPEVLRARVASLMFEAGQVPRDQWEVGGEHDNDARRAHQIAALAVAVDPLAYRSVAAAAGMTDDDIEDSTDYGTEIHRSWRRILQPLWMPAGVRSGEARVVSESGDRLAEELRASGLIAELETVLCRFDWHSQVEIRLVAGEGGAAWSRSQRAVTVHSAYVQRFIAQGEALARVK
jgi:hypothetical protein